MWSAVYPLTPCFSTIEWLILQRFRRSYWRCWSLTLTLILTLTKPWFYVRELTLILFEQGRKEVTLDRRVLILGSILCERANHSCKGANISLLILCKGGLRRLALVLTLFKKASSRSQRTNPSSKPMQGK